MRSWDCEVEEAVSGLIDQAFHKVGEHDQVPSCHTPAREGGFAAVPGGLHMATSTLSLRQSPWDVIHSSRAPRTLFL